MLIFETPMVTFEYSWFKAILGITFGSKLLFIDCVSGSKVLFINTSLVRALCCESGSKLVFVGPSLVSSAVTCEFVITQPGSLFPQILLRELKGPEPLQEVLLTNQEKKKSASSSP